MQDVVAQNIFGNNKYFSATTMSCYDMFRY